jgi:hypothetical protein
MTSNKGKFSADFHADTGYHFRPGRWLLSGIAVVVVLALAGWGIWGLGVATSGVHGRGEQTKQVNGSVNRTQWYHHFFDLKTAYDTQVQAVGLARKQLDQFNKDNPTGTADPIGQIAQLRAQDQTNLTGAEQQCVNSANAYNNDTQKTLVGAQFKAAGLPDTLDANACKE